MKRFSVKRVIGFAMLAVTAVAIMAPIVIDIGWWKALLVLAVLGFVVVWVTVAMQLTIDG